MKPTETLIIGLLTAFSTTLSGPSLGEASDSLVRPFTSGIPNTTSAASQFPLGEARVLRVTHNGADGPGSLRAALSEKGPRLIVFESAGVIDLAGRSLEIKEGFAFIAGETAPPPGVTLIRGSLVIEADHVIVRHLAVRPGDRGPAPGTPWQPDGITVDRSAKPVHHVLVQNCSATWAVDENASVSGPADTRPTGGTEATSHDVTLKDNLFAEALFRSTHAKGPHSMGLLIHDGIRRVTITGNLFASNNERNPRLKGGVTARVTGNVIYNWGGAAIGVGRQGNREQLDGVQAVVANNVAIAGPDTRSAKARVLVRSVDPGASILAIGNAAVDPSGRPLRELDEGIGPLIAWPAGLEDEVTVRGRGDTLSAVLRGAGARPAERDPIDQRIVASVIAGTGRIIDSQEAVGGYPVRAATTRPLTVPDGSAARAAWLEDFMNQLAAASTLDIRPLLNRLGIPR